MDAFEVNKTIGAVLSALYIGRLVFLTFLGSARSEEAELAHESPMVMTVPLLVLAVGAAAAGLELGYANLVAGVVGEGVDGEGDNGEEDGEDKGDRPHE